MWDPEQLAEIPVILDRLLAAGDPLGEWLAIRDRLDARTDLASDDRRQLRRRARWLRTQLGPRLMQLRVGPVHAIRERGLLIDVSASEASRDRLAELLDRPDASLLLRLRLRGDPANLQECLAWLADPSSTVAARASLRELDLDSDPTQASDPVAWFESVEGIAAGLAQLCSLRIDGHAIALPFTRSATAQAWTPARRTSLGRALASPDPDDRRVALEHLREHGVVANQLRSLLLTILDAEPDPTVRRAAFRVIPRLGAGAHAIVAIVVDAAAGRDDPELHEWLALMRR